MVGVKKGKNQLAKIAREKKLGEVGRGDPVRLAEGLKWQQKSYGVFFIVGPNSVAIKRKIFCCWTCCDANETCRH